MDFKGRGMSQSSAMGVSVVPKSQANFHSPGSGKRMSRLMQVSRESLYSAAVHSISSTQMPMLVPSSVLTLSSGRARRAAPITSLSDAAKSDNLTYVM